MSNYGAKQRRNCGAEREQTRPRIGAAALTCGRSGMARRGRSIAKLTAKSGKTGAAESRRRMPKLAPRVDGCRLAESWESDGCRLFSLGKCAKSTGFCSRCRLAPAQDLETGWKLLNDFMRTRVANYFYYFFDV